MGLKQVSFVERSSSSQRVPYQWFHCIKHHVLTPWHTFLSQHPLQYIKCHLQQRLPNIRDCNGFSFQRQRKPCYQCHNVPDIDTPLTSVTILHITMCTMPLFNPTVFVCCIIQLSMWCVCNDVVEGIYILYTPYN